MAAKYVTNMKVLNRIFLSRVLEEVKRTTYIYICFM